MEGSGTLERLRQILEKEFEIAPQEIQPAVRMDQLTLDSLAIIEMMFRLEDEFRIAFPQEPRDLTAQLQTVGDLVSCIDRLVAERCASAAPGKAAS